MPKIVPVKNIDSVLVDVKRPDGDYRRRQQAVNLAGLTPPSLILYRRSRLPIKLIVLFFVIAVGGAGFWASVNFKQITADLEANAGLVIVNFSTSLKSLREFRPDQASHYLQENENLLANLAGILNRYGSQRLMEVVEKVVPEMREARALVDEIQILNRTTLKATELLDDLRLNTFIYFQSDGPTLLARLGELRNVLNDLIKRGEAIQKRTAALRGVSSALDEIGVLASAHYFTYQPELHRWERFLDGLLVLLNWQGDIHFLVLFQNPSEIRPGGGFIGSYADVIVRNGQLYLIDVRDIYDAEGQLDLLVIPPQPLQATTHIWGARDANWFFDFPTSAKGTVYFLEKSKLYQEQNISFEAATAINIDVFKSILNITGSIELENSLIISEDNVVKELRQEIEKAKADKNPYPKQILRKLTPIVIEKIKDFNFSQKEKLIENILKNIEEKDIMFFAKDKALQDFFAAQGIAGAVVSLPHNFLGNYLGIVNANIEGAKSDAFIKQEIELEITIDSRGGSSNNLTVRRTHFGDKEKELWWRKQNQNYLQIFANPGATFVSLKGNNNPPSKFREVNYETQGYRTDPDVVAIEQTNIFLSDYKTWVGQAFGKTVFGAWFTVPAGRTKELELRYQVPPPSTGGIESVRPYEFIYEKQSGVDTRLKLTVHAPLGYRFQKSGSSVFAFDDEVKEGRFIQKLTLIPAN
jgi:hypothetical protein